MKASYSHHAILTSLLKKKQFDACRVNVEEAISALMAPELEDEEPSGSYSDAVQQLRERDRELAFLHIVWCRSIFGLYQFREAGEKADIAAFLARKLNDSELLGEALYRAGVCYSSHGDYPLAIQRLTECIDGGTDTFRGDAYYNRGFAHQSLAGYAQAIPDYEAAIEWTASRKPDLVADSRMNLAWVLILCHEFDRAEQVLKQLANEPGADADRTLQLQISHDRLHMSFFKGNHREAFKQAFSCMRQAGKDYPEIRAHVVLTFMGMAIGHGETQEAFTLGMFAKRLAGQAHRFDLDDEASRQMRDLECQEGTEFLVRSLQQLRQLLRGSPTRRKVAKG